MRWRVANFKQRIHGVSVGGYLGQCEETSEKRQRVATLDKRKVSSCKHENFRQELVGGQNQGDKTSDERQVVDRSKKTRPQTRSRWFLEEAGETSDKGRGGCRASRGDSRQGQRETQSKQRRLQTRSKGYLDQTEDSSKGEAQSKQRKYHQRCRGWTRASRGDVTQKVEGRQNKQRLHRRDRGSLEQTENTLDNQQEVAQCSHRCFREEMKGLGRHRASGGANERALRQNTGVEDNR